MQVALKGLLLPKKVQPVSGLQDLTFNTNNGFTHPSTGIWGGTSATVWGNYSLATQVLSAGADGWIEFQYLTTDANRCMMAFNIVNTRTTYDTAPGYLAAMFIYDTVLNYIDNNGSPSSTGHSMIIGEWARISRVGTVTKLQTSTDHVTWTDRQTYTTTSISNFYVNGDIDITASATNKIQNPKINTPAPFNKRIICHGNSLTYGASTTNPATKSYPGLLQAEPNIVALNGKVYNKGVNGQTTPQMIANGAAEVDSLYDSTVRTILIGWEGGNDLANNIITGTEAYNNLVTYYNARRTANPRIKIIAITIPYRDQTLFTHSSGKSDATYNAERLIMNNLLITNYTAFSDAILDLATKPGFTAYNAGDGLYDTDHLHFLDFGQLTIKNYLTPIISSVE